MKEMNRDFYIWAMAQLKSTSEHWGIDYTSCLENFRKDLPNVYKAFTDIYGKYTQEEIYKMDQPVIENPQNIAEVIYNILPMSKKINHDSFTRHQNSKYAYLNICSWNRKVPTMKCDLLLAILMFTEDFIDNLIESRVLIDEKKDTIIYGRYTTLEFCKREGIMFVNITIRGVMKLVYKIFLD